MAAFDRLPVSVALAVLVAAPRTTRAGQSEDADRALFPKYCGACHGADGTGHGVCANRDAQREAMPILRLEMHSEKRSNEALSLAQTAHAELARRLTWPSPHLACER
jgi:cytochrome c